ncbi:MAG: alpha-mannosidase [Clostridia bacterium]|nr:alpha-mannosidase [Clostridia bacterium]
MNLQMVNTILARVEEKKFSCRRDFGGWSYRLADFSEDCVYTHLSDWAPLERDTVLPWEHTTLARCEVTFPEEICEGEGGVRDYLFLRFGGMEGYITVDGEIWHGHDGCRDRIPLKKEWAGQKKCLEVVAFTRGKGRHFLEYSYFGRVDLAVEELGCAMRLAWDFYNLDNDRGEKDSRVLRERVLGALRDAMLGMDVDCEGEAFREECARAAEILRDRIDAIDDGDIRGEVSLVGHTHIDVAWLWQLKDTVRKCAHTFSNILRLMEEYPDFQFACSQMQLLDYTKTHYPELYEQLKVRIAEGRFELCGTMWVESDCNVVSGESLVRQILYGVRFMEAEFGCRNEIAWLPDTFGFQPNLPQILKKTGTKFFYSNKIHWQGQNRFPYTSFRWRGIDGSEVTASIPRTANFYNGCPEPSQLRFAQDMNLQAGREDAIILPFGHGDGGGGPTREMILQARGLADFPGLPRTRHERAADFFHRLEERREELPVWYGDLYIETHRGTLTTMGECKKNNRMAEVCYQSAEKLGVAAACAGMQPDWSLLSEGWKEILTLQFHDILPGSSINEVYSKDCREGYARIFRRFEQFTAPAVRQLAGEKGGIWVYNALSFDRTAPVEFDCRDESLTAVRDAQGRLLPTVVTERGGRRKLCFLAECVPALGASVYTPVAACAPAGGMDVTETDAGITVENAGYILSFDRLGRLTRLYDKAADREALSAPGNALRLFRDGPQREDAWNIYPEYREREIENAFTGRISLSENNALRTVLSLELTGERCTLRQDIVIRPDTPRIDFVTKVDWQEKHRVLRVYFPCNVQTPYVALEEGFGTYMRPTVASTPFELSRFEFCAHRFADLSEGDYGVALLNDCKYGHDVDGGTLGLTLLRATTHPSTVGDRGEHEITYSVFPHAGDWRAAAVVRQGLDLNTPLLSAKGSTPLESPLRLEDKNLILDTVKAAEDGDGFILRLYECNGNRGKGELIFAKTPVSVEETDLLERPERSLAAANRLPVEYGPYEIKTYRVRW